MAVAYTLNGATVLMIGGDAAYQARVTRSLDKINQTLAGQALLNGIRANRMPPSPSMLTIHPGANECACLSPDSSVSRTLLAQALFDRPNTFPAELAACMAAAVPALDAAAAANLINAAPVYDIQGLPGNAPSHLGVTAAHVTAWLNGGARFPLPFEGAQVSRLQRALLVALWPQARNRPGTGGHSRVRWNAGSGSIGLTNGRRQVRSKSIGLAHELVHAYYNGCGLQMGRDNPLAGADNVPTVHDAALFEYMCVGLGVWSNEPVSENAIRSQWHMVVSRTLFPGGPPVRYGMTPARPCY